MWVQPDGSGRSNLDEIRVAMNHIRARPPGSGRSNLDEIRVAMSIAQRCQHAGPLLRPARELSKYVTPWGQQFQCEIVETSSSDRGIQDLWGSMVHACNPANRSGMFIRSCLGSIISREVPSNSCCVLSPLAWPLFFHLAHSVSLLGVLCKTCFS